MRQTELVVPEAARSVDGALLRELADLAGIVDPTVSPVEMADIQLNVGCDGESAQCMSAVAAALQVDVLIVRKLTADARGALTLRVMRFDPHQAPSVRSADASAPSGSAAEVTAQVPRLVRELYGIAEAATAISGAPPQTVTAPASAPPAAPAPALAVTAPAPTPAPAEGGEIGALTWITLGVGTAVLATGIVIGVSADGAYDDLQHTRVDTREDARRLRTDYDDVETRGTVAAISIPTGGAILALGAALLAFDLTSTTEATSLSVAPLPSGAMVSLKSTVQGL